MWPAGWMLLVVATGATPPLEGGRAVAVHEGVARFAIPGDGSSGPTLVIVSSMARSEGPFTLTLRARRHGVVDDEGARSPLRDEAAVLPASPVEPRSSAGQWGPVPSALSTTSQRHTRPSPPARRVFHLMVREGDPACARNYLPVQARLFEVGEHIQVYVDVRDLERVAPGLVGAIVSTFDSAVYPVSLGLFGPVRDPDGDGRLTVLITSWLSRLGGGRLAVDGCFRCADMGTGLSPPFSNGCDLLYLNASLVPGPHLQTVLAHEYAHAVTYSHKADRASREEEGWLDEGIAHLVEDLHGFSRTNLDHRSLAFLQRPERYRLIVPDYYAATLFRSHGHRGSAYLFLRWCGERHGLAALLRRLIESGLTGTASLEAAMGRDFEALFRAWSQDLYMGAMRGAAGTEEAGLPRGPAATWVEVDGRAHQWEAAGTSPHYVIVDGAGVVEVRGPREAQLQVTAVRLPERLPRLEVSARRDPERPWLVRINARERRGEAVTLTGLRWTGSDEPIMVPEQAFGTARLEAWGRLASVELRAPIADATTEPIAFQVVGEDDRSRRVWAWGVLPREQGETMVEPAVP